MKETFYQALQHIDQFEGRSSLYTWLCQIGKNAWLKEIRRNKRYSERPIEELELVSMAHSVEDSAIRREEYDRIRKALYQLEEPYKSIFVLHVFGEVKLKELADAYGKSESWARVTFHRAKQQIIAKIE